MARSTGDASGKSSSKASSGKNPCQEDRDRLTPQSSVSAPPPLEWSSEASVPSLGQVEALRSRVAKQEETALEQAREVQALKDEAEQAKRNKEAARVEHLMDVKALEVSKDVLAAKLSTAREEKARIKEDRDLLADTIEGLKARHAAEMERAMSRQAAETLKKEELRKDQAVEMEDAQAKNHALAQKLQQAEVEKQDALKEADVLRVKEAMARAEKAAKDAKVQAMRSELNAKAQKEGRDLGRQNPLAKGIIDTAFEAEARLQEEMAELQKQMKGLIAVRGDTQKQDVRQRVGEGTGRSSSSTSLPEKATPQASPQLGGPGSWNPRAGGWTGFLNRLPLMTIAEGEDLRSGDGSIAGAGAGSIAGCSLAAPSGRFSSNGDEGAGDLHDFDEATDDPLEFLKRDAARGGKDAARKSNAVNAAEKARRDKADMADQLAAKQREKELLQEEVAARDDREQALHLEMAQKVAADESKIARLQQQLLQRWEEQEEKDQVILEMKQREETKDVRIESMKDRLDDAWMTAESRRANLQVAREELQRRHNHQEDLDQWIGELQEQLDHACEARRLADSRCEDLRTALEAQEARFARAVQDLQEEIRLLRAGAGQGGGTGDEEADLKAELAAARQEVRRLEEEKNLLQNVLEWKEVHFRSRVEDLELQLSSLSTQFERDRSKSLEDLCPNAFADAEDNLLARLARQELDQARHLKSSGKATRFGGPIVDFSQEGKAFVGRVPGASLVTGLEDQVRTDSECGSQVDAVSDASVGEALLAP